jgi:hypothetical protein
VRVGDVVFITVSLIDASSLPALLSNNVLLTAGGQQLLLSRLPNGAWLASVVPQLVGTLAIVLTVGGISAGSAQVQVLILPARIWHLARLLCQQAME